MTANITDTLSFEEKRALLAQLLEKEINKPAVFPLSFSQQRVWFFDQWEPQSPVYNIPAAIRFRGALDVNALQRTLDEILRRHEALRTTFPATDSAPLQLISPPAPFPLEVLDLSNDFADLDQEAEEARVAQLITREATRPFDLTHGPLFRGLLVQLSDRHFVLVLNMHHIVSDGWSLGVLVNEVTSLYTAYHQGQPPTLPELPLQYADFAVWQRQWLSGAVLEEQLSYWREQLGGTLPALQLLSDKARPAVQTYKGAATSRALPRQLSGELKALTQREGATLFMTLLAAFQALLYRYTGQHDILVGTPIAGRSRPELELLVGFFTNTLVMRTEVEGELSFAQLLGRVRETALGAYAHQDVPFEKLVQELQPERDMSRQPLFQVMFILQNASIPTLELPEVTLELLGVETGTAKFDLTLVGEERADGQIVMTVEYNSDLYGAESIERLLMHYERLLQGVVAEPERAVGSYDILGMEEREQVLSGWGAERREYERGATLGELLGEAARAHAGRSAVSYEGEEISYAELWERSNQLGRYLQREGVGPETIVAVLMERSLEMVVALVAVVKAGGAYLPIEPSQPPERMEYMLRDAGVGLVLSQEQLLDRLPPHEARVICLDSEWEVISREDAADIDSGVSPDNAAYVIYTSGSTGQPKGAINTHRAITNRLLWMQEQYELTPADCVLQKTPFGFDVSVWEFFWPLIMGARLVVARPNGHQDSAYLAKLIEEQQITTLHFVPSMLQVFLEEELLEQRCRSVKRSICSGEALPAQTVRRFYDRIAGATLHNLYGPTEAAVDVTYWECPRELLGQAVPIGRPITNIQIYILDTNLEPVPIGVPGELHIGGVGLARGYLARPELTAEKFIPDPFSTEAGARIYKTGDLARYQPDGNIEYLGRLDHQVKIRGFRIELGEIEYVLRQHPGVHEAVLMARQDEGLEKRLVAYLTTEQESAPNVSELRSFLKERLPEYMIPSAFMVLDQIPLSPNGKVDRRALPAPEQTRPNLEQAYEAPRTATEEALANIWKEVLRLEWVGVHDSFFELGGDSLLATQVVARAKAVFHIDVPLRSMFEAPTIAGMSANIEKRLGTADESRAVPIERVSRDANLPLSFSQQRVWFFDRWEPGNPVYNIPTAIRFRGALDVNALQRTLDEIVRRHEALRTTFPGTDSAPLQLISPPAPFPLEVLDLSSDFADLDQEAEEARVAQLITREATRPFDLIHGPLFRGLLVQLSDWHFVLVLNMHHIVSDGWSLGVLVNEVTSLYTAYHQGQPPTLPELPLQYADFAVWQRQWLSGAVLEEQLSYWREQLGGTLPALQLLSDKARPAVQTYKGAATSRALPRQLSGELKALTQREGATLFMTLLAAFQALLYRYTGQHDILVGTPIAGRSRPELELLIGFFVNTLVLRTEVEGELSFAQLLGRVRETALGAYAHQDVPFEKLVQELQPERDMSRQPLFQVMFVLQNATIPPLELPEVTLEVLGVETGTAKFDLTLVGEERADGQIVMSVEYNSDLYGAESIERLLMHYERLLQGVVAEPERAVGSYDILGVEEREQVLSGWGAERREYERGATLGELLGEAARAHAGRSAVSYEGEEISYAELWERSNQLGRYLQREGVGPETIVAVLMERSLEMVVALVAVVKAGGAYLPIEPSQPPERMEYMLRDAGVGLVLSQEQLLDRLPPHEARVICIDSEWEVISREDAADIDSGVSPDNAAYVIYTSGSTGQPKGVVISHYNVVRLFEATQHWYNFDENDVWTLFHSYAFDFSVWELWGALLYGGRLVVVPYWVSRSPETFYKLLVSEQVTVLNQTPSAFRQLIHVEELTGVSTELALRLIIFGGEALELQSLKPWFDRHGDQKPQLVNMYGITETTVHVTYRPVTEIDLSTASGSMIGIPINDLEIYILDRYLQPVPVGVAGEMCVGGVGLARGYLNRPALTAERFVPNPFNNKSSERLYRSGDLARFVGNGDIEYLGRIDHQVKIRGFRIELGEIEAALDQYPGVRESVVITREDSPGEKRLAAYLVVNTQSAPSISELRSYMKEKLPEYMVPSAFVLLDALPLTSNGKVDRLALPVPGSTTSLEGEVYVAPRNEIEELLTQIWEEVLGINPIGIHDDYFALGGDSIRVIQIVYKANAYNLAMSVKDIFQASTVCKLASRIAVNKDGGRESSIPMELIELPQHVRASLPDDVEDAYPVSRMQELMLERYVHDTQEMGVYHVQQWFRIQDETLSITALEQSLKMLVQKHAALRTVFMNVDGMQLQAVKKTVNFQVAEEDTSALTEEQQEAYLDAAIRKDRVSLFDINNTDEPLFRFKILKRSENDIDFLMTINHAIADGWGNIEFLKELFQLYQSTKTNGEVVLPAAFNSFKEFIAMEKEILASDEAKSFWQDHLKNESHRPLERIVVDDEPFAEKLNYVLDTELTAALQSLAQSQKVSLKTVYLSAYLDVISEVQKQRTATIGVVSNGRSERLTNPLKSLGLFWNMVPVCAPIDSENKFAQLANVQQLLIDIESYSRYPLSQILEDQGKSELFFATLNFLNFHNAKQAFESGEVKLPSSGNHDKFHYPLNYVVSVNPNSGQVWLRVEYDRAYFSVETVESMTDDYIARLKSLAVVPERAFVTAASV